MGQEHHDGHGFGANAPAGYDGKRSHRLALAFSQFRVSVLGGAIKKLETELGGKLFFREGNRLKLTEFGRRMAPHMTGIVDRTQAAAVAAESFRLLAQQPVRVGVMPTLGPIRVARFLSDFERSDPGIEVAVRERQPTSLAEWLEADEIDAAILNPIHNPGPSTRVEPLYAERYVVLLPAEHDLRERNVIALADLDGRPYVDRLACERSCPSRRWRRTGGGSSSGSTRTPASAAPGATRRGRAWTRC